MAYHIGGRGTKAAKKFWDKIPPVLQGCEFLKQMIGMPYRSIIPCAQHKVGKDLTFYIEGSTYHQSRVSRLVRKSLSFSKLDKWHDLAIGWFFWQFNLERQHYI
ncbi:MAG: IS1 family transposase [Saprospiraceae bacterium]